jgi:superfamily II DNA or RNA helicase
VVEGTEHRLRVALEEVAALRAENDRLRTLLGLDRRDPTTHRTARTPTLFSKTAEEAEVDAGSPAEAKMALLRSLFGARSDVFATRWENQSTGKSGWSPAVRGGWSARKRINKDYLPLTDEVFARHLDGDLAVGIYPLLPGDTCALLACDFDGSSWPLDALAYLDVCHDAGVPAALERSRSGNGAHVWVFFEAPVPAATARSLGASLLRQAMAARAELDLASYDRFFPSQDFMPKGSFGNLIALPLHGECLRRGTTAFLDPTTMEPWPDQWAFLSSLARLPVDAARKLADSLRPVDAGPAVSLAQLAREHAGAPAPPVIRARFGSSLSIARAGLPPGLVAALKHLSSIHNPVFYEKQRMRFSTWNTPRFIRCYREDLEWLHLPRGLDEQVHELIDGLGSRLDMTDVRAAHGAQGLQFCGELRSHQEDAVAALLPRDLGVLVAPPGAGKTVMACAAIAHHDAPTLVLVDRKPLLEQWRERLTNHLALRVDQIGLIGGGKRKPSGLVDVAMIQSIARRDDREEFFSQYGLVVVDECHHLPAVSFEAAVRDAPVRRWLGLTATPYRRDGLEGIITLQCGPVRHEIAAAHAGGSTLLRRELVVHETATRDPSDGNAAIQDVFRALVEDDQRTEEIAADVHDAVLDGRTCLVLTQRTDHIERLVQRLRVLGQHPLVLRGGLGTKARAAVADAIAGRQDGEGIVLVATGSYLGEGFDWSELDTLFLAFPIAFKGRVVQYVGRLLRAHEGKHHVELHDYVDTQIPVLHRMHHKRLPAYRTLGFDLPSRRPSTPSLE